jgi:hypothetical protein
MRRGLDGVKGEPRRWRVADRSGKLQVIDVVGPATGCSPREAPFHRGQSAPQVPLGHSDPRHDVVTTEHTCPKCHSKAIDRVPRKDVLERFISKMRGKRLYRCLDCDHHFKDRPLTKR